MTESVVMAEVWRGPFLECTHRGAAVVATPEGRLVETWGDPDRVILPRSACKMVQALPMVESGAADAVDASEADIALAAGSHQGAAVHVGRVAAWLDALGLGQDALHCGAQLSRDPAERQRLLLAGEAPGQVHNNCSGKHAGFLTLMRHLGGGPDYELPDHPVQKAVREATEALADAPVEGHAIDGCSAPNFALPLRALAVSMARFARPRAVFGGARAGAVERIVAAMAAHPVMVAGEGRACTALIRAARDGALAKTGAEGMFTAILPGPGLGIALKIDDGSTRAAEAAMAALLVRHGAIAADNPTVRTLMEAPLLNRRGLDCGRVRAADALLA